MPVILSLVNYRGWVCYWFGFAFVFGLWFLCALVLVCCSLIWWSIAGGCYGIFVLWVLVSLGLHGYCVASCFDLLATFLLFGCVITLTL